jgi:hypothetical protein
LGQCSKKCGLVSLDWHYSSNIKGAADVCLEAIQKANKIDSIKYFLLPQK